MATKRVAKGAASKAGAKRRVKSEVGVGQVSPYTPDPSKFTRYQIIQNGYEVGFVYVQGSSITSCVETWQLYLAGVTGVGEFGYQRRAYVYPSYQSGPTSSPDVTTRYIFREVASSIRNPTGMGSSSFQLIRATCTS